MPYVHTWNQIPTSGNGWSKWGTMANDKLTTKLRILYEVEIAKWRIGDQNEVENREWALHVYDRNQQQWVQVNALDAPGEKAIIKHIQVVE